MSADPAAQEEMATVWADEAGVPLRLVWSGRRFTVTGRPIQWFDRRPWWTTTGRAPAGQAADVLEQPMWQVRAQAPDGQILIFDLIASSGMQWPVTGIYD